MPDGSPLPRSGKALRAIAEEAVHSVYEHGSGRKRSAFEDERRELARRFRHSYGSDSGGKANAAPYFVGVFDTVAALGSTGLRRIVMLAGLVLAGLSASALGGVLFALATDWSFWSGLVATATALIAVGAWKGIRSRLKVIRGYPNKGDLQWHWTGWRFGNYDTNFDSAVAFGRHALAIDERRTDFKRVKWGQPSEGDLPKSPEGLERFEQRWFAGNHSDIGGSYPEDESRLSDIALQWMVEEAKSLPHPIIVDRNKLRMYPSADGMQHCEVEALREAYPLWWPNWLRRTWASAPRFEASGAPYHPTVLERLKIHTILDCGKVRPYRPEALSKDPALADLYDGDIERSCSATES